MRVGSRAVPASAIASANAGTDAGTRTSVRPLQSVTRPSCSGKEAPNASQCGAPAGVLHAAAARVVTAPPRTTHGTPATRARVTAASRLGLTPSISSTLGGGAAADGASRAVPTAAASASARPSSNGAARPEGPPPSVSHAAATRRARPRTWWACAAAAGGGGGLDWSQWSQGSSGFCIPTVVVGRDTALREKKGFFTPRTPALSLSSPRPSHATRPPDPSHVYNARHRLQTGRAGPPHRAPRAGACPRGRRRHQAVCVGGAW